MNVIETCGLYHRFGLTEAVCQLNLMIPEGRICALLGPNSAGKTTLLKLLLNLIEPTAGRARVLGVESRCLGSKEWAHIGYVAEGQVLPDWMTVRQYLNFCGGVYPAWDKDLERELVGRLEVPEGRELRQLSRGMRMRVSLLSALAFRPSLLMLDEPFAGLDPVARDELTKAVFSSLGAGTWSAIVASHDLQEVERFADWVVVMKAGRVLASEPLETMLGRFRRVEVTLPDAEKKTAADKMLQDWPKTWWGRERAGNLVRWIDSAYDAERSETECRAHWPNGTMTVFPLTLREIYLALLS
jgi:ABC-2 type transport system ATP-binding protein